MRRRPAAPIVFIVHLSWWCGLTRQQLHDAVAQHDAAWRAQKATHRDHIGAQIIGWEPPLQRKTR